MDRKYLFGATTALALVFGASAVTAAGNEAATGSNLNSATTATGQATGAAGTAAGATEGRQVAEACLQELREVEQRLQEEGRILGGSELRTLHQAATIFAQRGMDDACEDVVAGMEELGEQAERRELSEEQRAEYQERLRNARPIAEMPGRHRASELIGREVVTLDGTSIGDVDDVMIGADGSTRYLLIGSGGFLGIGEDYVPVEFDSVRVLDDDTLAVAVDAERFEAAPRVETSSIDERLENWTADVRSWWDRNVRDQEAQAQ